jgi:plastocyanin
MRSLHNMRKLNPGRQRRRPLLLATGSLVLLALVVAACGQAAQPTPSSGGSGTPVAGQAAVVMQNTQFQPNSLTVKVGTTVTWTNKESLQHTVTSDTGLFDSGLLSQGGTFSYTFTKAGEYSYYCTPHRGLGMTGKIIVTP